MNEFTFPKRILSWLAAWVFSLAPQNTAVSNYVELVSAINTGSAIITNFRPVRR